MDPSLYTDETHGIRMRDMPRRFIVSALLTLPLMIMATSRGPHRIMDTEAGTCMHALLAAIVIGWCGKPVLKAGLGSLLRRQPDRFALVTLPCMAMYGFSLLCLLLPVDASYKAADGFTAAASVMLCALFARLVEMNAGAAAVPALRGNRLIAFFVPGVLVLAALAGGLWLVAGPALSHAVYAACAVMIIACPGAFGLAVSMPVLVASTRGIRSGIRVRRSLALQTLARCDTLVVDKTGTITEGKPQLLAVMPSEGYTETNLLRMAASLERLSEHPLADAVVDAATERSLGFLEVHAFKVIPGKGVTGIMDGRSVGLGNAALMQSLGVSVLKTKAEPYRSQGQIVSFISVDAKPAGFITVADPIKAATPDSVKALKDSGLQLVMLTSDSKSTAQAIGRKLGIDMVEAEIPPERKAGIIAELKARGRTVAMAGDIITDSEALADVSIALGTRNAIAMERADITLPGGELDALVRARRLSRATNANIRQNLFLAVGYNAASVPLAAGLLYPLCGLSVSPVLAAFAMVSVSVAIIVNARRMERTAL